MHRTPPPDIRDLEQRFNTVLIAGDVMTALGFSRTLWDRLKVITQRIVDLEQRAEDLEGKAPFNGGGHDGK